MTPRRHAMVAVFALCAFGWSDPIAIEHPVHAAASPPSAVPPAPAERKPIRGTDFPDGVVALTWDDGPDAHTLELATYLHDNGIVGTFFVVASWVNGLSEEPGYGETKLKTGYEYIPILDQVAALGQRLGNHTKNHVLLGHVTTETAEVQLGRLPLPIAVVNRMRMFRAPAGWWTAESVSALDQPAFASLVGPVHWDIDGKDWECSLYCRSDSPATECEPGPIPNELRVREEVVAARYLAKIEAAKHGIVLMHDRVGDVGSRYALNVTRRLVPELLARHYVFAAPVLRFSALAAQPGLQRAASADVDGDGVADTCELVETGIACNGTSWLTQKSASGPLRLGDLNGDGRADVCFNTTGGVGCALSDGRGFKAATIWSAEHVDDFTLADVNSDARADLCSGARCGLAP